MTYKRPSLRWLNAQGPMRPNRSVPPSSVVPVLAYPDVSAASDWLCAAFGFRERLRIGDHRAQLVYGNGAVVVTEGEPAPTRVQVRVEDANAHSDQARDHGAEITAEPTDHAYGERQYTAVDFAGYHWTFSETITDVDPESWGATRVDRREVARGLTEDDESDWVRIFSTPEQVADTFEGV
jgi:uncharacterized glyoxalase superfamily protein PhnB